jgi:tryptophan synthase beta chain
MRDWVESMDTTHYVMGTVCGPHPFPQMVMYFQAIVGTEARAQLLEATGRLPGRVYACVGGGSNASGIFAGFLDDASVELVGVEAGGLGLHTGMHASRIAGAGGTPGVAQGYKTYFLQNAEGLMNDTHSVSAGLDYIGVSPILAHLHDVGRVRFESATDEEVIAALRHVMRAEGLIPALETSHAFVTSLKEAPSLPRDEVILVNQSGRADKDIFTVADALGDDRWREFLRSKVEAYESRAKAQGGKA